jgi:hypothetical protein
MSTMGPLAARILRNPCSSIVRATTPWHDKHYIFDLTSSTPGRMAEGGLVETSLCARLSRAGTAVFLPLSLSLSLSLSVSLSPSLHLSPSLPLSPLSLSPRLPTSLPPCRPASPCIPLFLSHPLVPSCRVAGTPAVVRLNGPLLSWSLAGGNGGSNDTSLPARLCQQLIIIIGLQL